MVAVIATVILAEPVIVPSTVRANASVGVIA